MPSQTKLIAPAIAVPVLTAAPGQIVVEAECGALRMIEVIVRVARVGGPLSRNRPSREVGDEVRWRRDEHQSGGFGARILHADPLPRSNVRHGARFERVLDATVGHSHHTGEQDQDDLRRPVIVLRQAAAGWDLPVNHGDTIGGGERLHLRGTVRQRSRATERWPGTPLSRLNKRSGVNCPWRTSDRVCGPVILALTATLVQRGGGHG